LTRKQEKNYVPFLILLQHSFSLQSRIIAAEPIKANEKILYETAGLDAPKITNTLDLSGCLWIRKVWKECIDRCDGKVIIVQCADNHILDDASKDLVQKNGVMIDAYSNPLGWDDEDDINHFDVGTGLHSTIQLESILAAIRKALQILNESDADNEETLRKPIPVLFDSGSHLILHHGVEKISMFFTIIKQTIYGCSPIIFPTLNETMTLIDRRILEEYADGTLTLHNGVMNIVKRSVRAGGMISGGFSVGLRLSKEIQYFDIRRGELVLKTSKDQDKKKIVKDPTSGENKDDTDISVSQPSKEKHGSIKIPDKLRPILQHEPDDFNTPTQISDQPKVTGKPLIYMQDDDPELEDFDEDEPDDDLDI
jgi:hypothetical protein